MSDTTLTTATPADSPASASTDVAFVAEPIVSIGWLVDTGDHRAARRAFTTFWRRADDQTRVALIWALAVVERHPHKIAAAKLRRAAACAPTPGLRALIEYVAEHADPTLYRPAVPVPVSDPDTDPSWSASRGEQRALLAAFGHQFPLAARRRPEFDAGLYEPNPVTDRARTAARDNFRHVDPALRIPRSQQRRRRARVEPKVVTEYVATRLGVDDDPDFTEQPIGYGLDYDRASLPTARGLRCVSCWIERPCADAYTHGRRSDDSLCTDCRDAARRDGTTDAGVPELTVATRRNFVFARCAFIADRYPAAATVLLRSWWIAATGTDRDLIAAWVDRHPLTPTPAPVSSATPDTDPAPVQERIPVAA